MKRSIFVSIFQADSLHKIFTSPTNLLFIVELNAIADKVARVAHTKIIIRFIIVTLLYKVCRLGEQPRRS